MRKYLFIALLLFPSCLFASFRVAQLTDIHLSRSNDKPLEDLQRTIDDINAQDSIALVLVTGDITEAGDEQSLQTAYQEFSRLNVPFYVTSGNHETTWSETGCTVFPSIFGSDRFAFTYGNVFFIGFNSGPKLKMSDGHVVPQDLIWAKACLDTLPVARQVVVVTHYPIQEGDVDNWYEVTELFRNYNTQFFLGGHYHRNLVFNADGIPNILQRSNLRDKEEINGYGLVTFSEETGEVHFAEKIIGQPAQRWHSLALEHKDYAQVPALPRPSFEMNASAKPYLRCAWQKQVGVGVYNAAAVAKDGKVVFVGDDEGMLHAYSVRDGKERWSVRYDTGRITSVPVADDQYVYYTTTRGNVFCLRINDGSCCWSRFLGEEGINNGQYAISGCPILVEDAATGKQILLVGGNGYFYALDAQSSVVLWKTAIEGYCVSRPCVYDNKVYFGAWGCYFYALHISDGTLAWSWSNGKSNDKFSPAAVWPVLSHDKVFIVAPDRYMTCLSAETGEEVWRTNENVVRENIGLSLNGSKVYARCMRDTVFALDAEANEIRTIWKRSAQYGYDHNPSMMVELACGQIVFGTKNGLLHGVDATTGEVIWRYKIGNCLVNTITPIGKNGFIATSSDGQVLCFTLKSLKL